MLIRKATLKDIPALIELGRTIHAESELSILSYDSEKLSQTLKDLVESKRETHCFFVAEDSERRLFGAFIGCVEEYFFSYSLVAHSIVLYVDPKWRGSPAAVKFIHAFRKWALNRDVAQICIGVATGVTIGRTDRFLKRLGFKMTGGNYALVVKKGLGNQRLVS